MATKSKNLGSNTTITMTSLTLLPECSRGLMNNLGVEIIDEDLDLKESGGSIYVTRNRSLVFIPQLRVRKINLTTGVETFLFPGTDYTVDETIGEITLTSPTSDLVRADYFYEPLDGAVQDNLLALSIKEISVLIHRPINAENIPADYTPAICRRFTTNVLRTLQVEARDFFSISIAGRSISKDNIVTAFDAIIKDNEATLLQQLNQLRHWNTTSRLT